MGRPATRLSLIFFLSGAAALLFETLWFRLCGLTFGNTAWASALVLTSFMTGLAIGNLLAVRVSRGRDALKLYAKIEGGIAVTGLVLVLILPFTQDLFAPLFRAILGSDFALNAARLVLAFVLLCVPTTLMGATLPTVVPALSRSVENYGRALGLLYGWNTMGAVLGALAGELLFIRAFGVRGTGVIAACFSGAAALLAFTTKIETGVAPRFSAAVRNRRAIKLLVAAALSGFALLALEVIWFRFVVLFIFATSLAFAVMLAVVLLGIAAGALIASMILRREEEADLLAGTIAAISGVVLIVSYAGFNPSLIARAGQFRPGEEQIAVLVDSLRLMLPVSLMSGVLFTLIGRAVERELHDETRAAAVLTAFNTIGAAIGSAVAGFVLIPTIGIERSFFAIAIVYGVAAILLFPRTRRSRLMFVSAVVILAIVLVIFPFGSFRNTFLPLAARDYLRGARIAAVREGPIETAIYLRNDVAGRPYVYRLFTNGYSMASTAFPAKRYMSMFAWVPLALRPEAKSALLISFGVGVTANSLAHSPQLQSIDVVDISRDILGLSELAWPGASNPLRNPRVNVHVEDGRFFLRTTDRKFDLITAEPPPPKTAGVVSLYTEEYFRLVHDRLSDHGIASYWLPVYQLSVEDTRSIVKAFCNAFDDCSLWSGAGTEWMLVGSRASQPVSESGFARQWSRPDAGTWLRWIGVEQPEQLAATFLADASDLRRFTGDTPPLTDDRPLRLSNVIGGGILPEYARMHATAAERFARSAFISRTLPASIRQRAMGYFGVEQAIDATFNSGSEQIDPRLLVALLTRTQLRIAPRIVMRTNMWLEEIARDAVARGSNDPQMIYIVAVGELADRRYGEAATLFRRAMAGGLAGAAPYADLAEQLAKTVKP